ncbi:ABC transporter substrate-binding protein [Aquimarina agarilytica]|uniref:ABC transporter substrate-binding protein n=1 Tax=Aquimarina agarilytica TaxID=1087449 RepID=UPI00028815D9|nr:ABC transporter substrate-binding protein [Aquimarina agarilytica]
MKTTLFRLLLLFPCILLCINCVNPSTKNRDHLVFRYNEAANITTLDPAFARNKENIWGTNQLYNSLVQLDEKLKIIPDIAKSWSISEDLKTYTFILRNDVYFHKHAQFNTKDSTRTVVASDFTYSFDRLKDPKVASPGSWVLDKVANYKAINDTIFQINLTQAFPAYLGLLSMRYCSVIPKEIVSFYGNEFRRNPIGTGPFQFKAWEENTKLVYRKNPIYFEKDKNGIQLPYLEAVAITFLPDKQSEFLQFIQGNLDLMNDIDSSFKDDLLTQTGKLQPNYSDRIILDKSPFLNSVYVGFYLGNTQTPVQNINLRKAINHGFDRKAMITYLRNGIGTPALGGFIPMGIEGYNGEKGFYFDQKLAKKYLKKYVQETKDSQPSIRLATVSDYVSLCEFIQRELQKIGIDVQVDVMPAPTLRKQKHSGKLELFRASWIADYPDAENFMLPYYSKNFTPNGPNYTHFKNKTFDRLYEQSFMIPDLEERKLLYQKMDSILIAEAPIIPLYYDEFVRFTQNNVSGIPKNPQNFLFLKTAKKTIRK